MKFSTKEITHSAIFAALICIMSLISLSIGTIPLTLSLFGVMSTAIILGAKKGLFSVIIYILSGAIGLPVFSGFNGGIQVLFGPTGGYIWSYIFIAFIIGKFCERLFKSTVKAIVKTALVCFFCLFLCYLAGSLQYALVTGTAFRTALITGGLIFLPFDIIKVIFSAIIGTTIRKRIYNF